VYRLDAVSGKAVMDHPTAKRMLGDIRSGAITGLMLSKLARLARNTKESLDFAEMFRACKEGVEITLLQVPFGNDGEMATGPLRPGLRLAFAGMSGFGSGFVVPNNPWTLAASRP